ncbi:IQ domain-containing protein E isoform X5 [Sarcophilus harrisii]|uniref:IQ domain-containing protein E isoform X5 n=1 Tax=Sarcophilus harrisii TaxID=9305 RepID=UPI001301C3C5|nr:IQ domain-containing protein E isoform X5 [Sarcophilus harrisii]
MSQEISEQGSEAGDDSLSAITYESDLEMKSKKKTFHKYPPRSPKSPYHTKPKQIASWRYLKATGTMPLSGRMALTPQKLWLGPSKQGHSPGAPVYREKEDMYDEIIELKKSLHSQKGDVDFMKTKLRRLEEENSRKDRQIEHLLDPNRGCEFARSMVDKRPGTGWVINGLKQRIIKLEQQCKEKDNTITKLQTDIKMTNLEEMRIAMETYYEEIHRLQVLLANTETTGKKSPTDKKSTQKRQKKLSATVLHLSRNVQELQEENQSLKEDLDRVLSNSPISNKAKGYSEWSKQRLMRRISELEKKVGELENTGSHSPEQVRLVPLIQSAPNTAPQDLLRSEHSDECDRLRGIVRKLKGDRSTLQAQLSDKDLEMKQLLQAKAALEKELKKVEDTEKDRKENEDTMRLRKMPLSPPTLPVSRLGKVLYRVQVMCPLGLPLSSLLQETKSTEEIKLPELSKINGRYLKESAKTGFDSPINEKNPISAVCKKSTSLISAPSSLGKEDSEVSSEEAAEELPADDDESIQPKDLKSLAHQQAFCAVSSHTRLQSIVAPPVDEVSSDDSDDIVISPSLPMKKKNSPHVSSRLL